MKQIKEETKVPPQSGLTIKGQLKASLTSDKMPVNNIDK